ncbi:uncharacterized protein [Nothobranchius furzeri]
MSCKLKARISVFVLVIPCYFYTFQLCYSVSLGRRKDGSSSDRADPTGWDDRRLQPPSHAVVQQVTWNPNPGLPGLLEAWDGFSAAGHTRTHVGEPEPDQTGDNFTLNSRTWTLGEVWAEERASAPHFEDGYQADFAGFSEVQGKVEGLSPDSSPYFSDWEVMSPLVDCGDDDMTLTASGPGFTHLQVDRRSNSPLSIFQLPSYCGYSVKASWSDLEMIVPYDGCYILQENGSYVLPMLWLGSPLKLSCPMMSAGPPLHSMDVPSVFCSSYGMAVQIQGQEHDLPLMGVVVNGARGPFVSEMCALQVDSQPQKFMFLIAHSAPCLIADDNLQLQLLLDDHHYVLSCPFTPQFPSVPTLSSGHPPDPIKPSLTPPLSPPSQTSDVYLSPGSQLQPFQHPSGSEKLPSFSNQLHYPLPPNPFENTDHVFKWPDQPPQHPYVLNYPHVPVYYIASAPKAEDVRHPAASHYIPYYPPETTAAPVTQPPPSPPPNQPMGYPSQTSPVHPPVPPYHETAFYSTAAPPPVPTSNAPEYPPKQFYLPPYFQLPTGVAPPREEPREPPGYHPHPLPQYQVPYPSLPRYPNIQPPPKRTPYTMSTPPDWLTAHSPRLKCLKERMMVFLPFADPQSLQVRDNLNTWQFLSSVPPQCGYMLQRTAGYGLVLQSPLPSCHSLLQTPTTISSLVKYWDFSVGQNRTLDLLCPYQSAPETPAPVVSVKHPTPPSPSISPPVSRTEVFCSFQHMKVVLPPGPTKEIFLKDIKGNLMNLLEAPKDCGYYPSEGKDGRIHLFLQLHSHCQMSVQGEKYVVSVIYMTDGGKKEAQVSCPVVTPRSEQECNLPSEYRLPCGSSSISQTRCLSMGCCFNKHPPACYYPMDECTIDRHMIFSVPASLTDPPLSPALLVAANNATCKPLRATTKYALFNIPMDGCGTRRVVLGKTVVYMLEITNVVQTVSLNYGTITRDSPVRLLVECRYVPGTVLSVGYVVKTPTFGPEIHTQGVFGVQLRIAKDAEYSSYYPQYHQPLHMLLGKPLHLEVRLLNSPDPSLVLLVHFCVAYPRSGKAVWVLLYNGCPNPLDPAPPQTVMSDPKPPSPRSQTRRFTISTFQFLPDGELKDMDEEIYFMCSTEICSPHDGPCVEGCFGH